MNRHIALIIPSTDQNGPCRRTSAVSLSRATFADWMPGCDANAFSTAEEHAEQCMPLTDTCKDDVIVQVKRPLCNV
jgi:hypothetical protein